VCTPETQGSLLKEFAILSIAKDLISDGDGKQRVLRFAQDDNSYFVLTVALLPYG